MTFFNIKILGLGLGWDCQKRQQSISYRLQNQFIGSHDEVPAADILFEFMLNALRLKNGVAHSTIAGRTGVNLGTATRALESAIGAGWVSVTKERLGCTPEGYLMIDEILQDLLPDKNQEALP